MSDPSDLSEGIDKPPSTQDAPKLLPSLCLAQPIPLLASASPKALSACMEPLGGLHLAPALQQQCVQSSGEAGESKVAPEGKGLATGHPRLSFGRFQNRHERGGAHTLLV